MRRIVVVLMAIVVWPGTLCSQQVERDGGTVAGEAAPGVVAVVNGEPVFFEDIERRLSAMHSGVAEASRADFDVASLMFRLVNDTLLAQEARALGMQDEPPIPGKLAALRQRLAVRRLEYEEIWSRAEPSAEEVRQAFERDYSTVTFRMISAYEREEAEALLDELRGGADFASMAREASVDPYSARGGLVQNVARSDIPREVGDEAFTSAVGTIVGPIRTSIGWAIIRTESFGEPDAAAFDRVEAEVRDIVRMRRGEALRADFGTRMRGEHPVVVEQELVDAVRCERLPDGRLVPGVDTPEAIIARVGERSVTAAEFGRALGWRWSGIRNQEAAQAAKPIVLGGLINEQLMIAEALRRGYDRSEEVWRASQAYEKELLVPVFLREVVGAGIEVDPEEVRQRYEEHLEEYRRPPRVNVAQLTVARRDRAEELAEVARSGAEWTWLARQHSIDDLAELGGEKGWIVPARETGALNEALFDARPGDVLGPFETDGEWVIYRVNAYEDQGYYSFEQSRPRVRSIIYQSKFKAELDQFIQTLRSRSEIEIRQDVLSSLRISGREVEEEGAIPEHGG